MRGLTGTFFAFFVSQQDIIVHSRWRNGDIRSPNRDVYVSLLHLQNSLVTVTQINDRVPFSLSKPFHFSVTLFFRTKGAHTDVKSATTYDNGIENLTCI